MPNYTIQEANTKEEILSCWEPIFELRPHLIKDQFVESAQDQQKEGYKLLYLKNQNGKVDGILGYRILNCFYSGKTLYIDDLCTKSTSRGNGYGGALLDYVIELAKQEKCNHVSLDSGYTRNNAHRLYLNKKFDIIMHHFGQYLPKP